MREDRGKYFVCRNSCLLSMTAEVRCVGVCCAGARAQDERREALPLIAENIPAAEPPSRTGAACRAAVVILDGGVSAGYAVCAVVCREDIEQYALRSTASGRERPAQPCCANRGAQHNRGSFPPDRPVKTVPDCSCKLLMLANLAIPQ